MNKLNIKKLHKDAILPTRNTSTDAGLDLYALDDVIIPPCMESNTNYPDGTITLGNGESLTIHRGTLKVGSAKIGTGIAMQIPDGYVGIVESKSGLGFNHGIEAFNGVIDSGFRGELKVKMKNLTDKPFEFKKGQKIAQLVIYPIVLLEPNEVEDLDDSSRGINGFGSSGR